MRKGVQLKKKEKTEKEKYQRWKKNLERKYLRSWGVESFKEKDQQNLTVQNSLRMLMDKKVIDYFC